MTAAFQSHVTKIALGAAAEHGFALGGGQALVAHGIVHRPTEDIDLFTDTEDGVRAATLPVKSALREAGLTVTSAPEDADLGDAFDGFADDFAEFEVAEHGDKVRLTLARFDRHRAPVKMTLGPVLHLDDLIGSKVAAMATRAEARDFVDVAAAMETMSRDDLVRLVRRSDPALTDEELADAMRTLDRLPDNVFERWLPLDRVSGLRQRFARWPR